MIDRIEKRRADKKMSIKDLCAVSGVPEATYRNILHGRSKSPSFDTICRLAAGVELSIDELIAITPESSDTEVTVDLQKDGPFPVTGSDISALSETFIRMVEQKDAAHREALASLRAQHESALARQAEQHNAELSRLMDIICAKRRAAFWAVTACCILSAALILLIAVDIIAVTA